MTNVKLSAKIRNSLTDFDLIHVLSGSRGGSYLQLAPVADKIYQATRVELERAASSTE